MRRSVHKVRFPAPGIMPQKRRTGRAGKIVADALCTRCPGGGMSAKAEGCPARRAGEKNVPLPDWDCNGKFTV